MRAIEVGFELGEALLRAQDAGFGFLQVGGDVAGAVGERLARRGTPRAGPGDASPRRQPFPLGGGQGGGADLDVVAEDAVVADLQGADTGALPLLPLQTGDPLAGVPHPTLVLVELGGEPGADDAAVARRGWRVVGEPAAEEITDLLAGATRVSE